MHLHAKRYVYYTQFSGDQIEMQLDHVAIRLVCSFLYTVHVSCCMQMVQILNVGCVGDE